MFFFVVSVHQVPGQSHDFGNIGDKVPSQNVKKNLMVLGKTLNNYF